MDTTQWDGIQVRDRLTLPNDKAQYRVDSFTKTGRILRATLASGNGTSKALICLDEHTASYLKQIMNTGLTAILHFESDVAGRIQAKPVFNLDKLEAEADKAFKLAQATAKHDA